jgi:uncharacterized protein (DUF2147 family)
MRFLFSAALLLSVLCCVPALAQSNADDCLGVWKTGSGKGMVQIYKKGDTYFGRIVWLKEPNDPDTGKPKLDKRNDDEKKRSRPVLGLVNLRDFKWDASEKEWTDGSIYDPENGEDYSCTMRLTDKNTLEVRGYILVSAFGRTDVWKRQVKK